MTNGFMPTGVRASGTKSETENSELRNAAAKLQISVHCVGRAARKCVLSDR